MSADGSGRRFATPAMDGAARPANMDYLVRAARRHLDGRRQRANFLAREMFGEPAWDMLLDLFIAQCENKRISISSACIASGGSATTALRWLARLETMNYVERVSDDKDKRRIFVRITPLACEAIAKWLEKAEAR